jgi:hypothetical protein
VDSVTPDEPRRAPIRWHVATVRDVRAESSYSITSAPEDAPLALTVERFVDGEVSPYLTDELGPVDELEVRGSTGGYKARAWTPRPPATSCASGPKANAAAKHCAAPSTTSGAASSSSCNRRVRRQRQRRSAVGHVVGLWCALPAGRRQSAAVNAR